MKIRHDHDASVVIVALSASVSLAERRVLGLGMDMYEHFRRRSIRQYADEP